jgi:hypothetical protein
MRFIDAKVVCVTNILLFHYLIKVRVIFKIRVFGTSMAGLIIIIIYNKSSRKSGSLLFYDLLGT